MTKNSGQSDAINSKYRKILIYSYHFISSYRIHIIAHVTYNTPFKKSTSIDKINMSNHNEC